MGKKENTDKVKKLNNAEPGQEEGNDDVLIRDPTEAELEEVKKPENQNQIETVRQKKKKKHKKIVETKQLVAEMNETDKNVQYLKKWCDNREEWKFEKLRQVAIQKNLFNSDKISKDIWPIALEYLKASKGRAKESLVKSAEQIIKTFDESDGKLSDKINKDKYKRARELVQLLE